MFAQRQTLLSASLSLPFSFSFSARFATATGKTVESGKDTLAITLKQWLRPSQLSNTTMTEALTLLHLDKFSLKDNTLLHLKDTQCSQGNSMVNQDTQLLQGNTLHLKDTQAPRQFILLGNTLLLSPQPTECIRETKLKKKLKALNL